LVGDGEAGYPSDAGVTYAPDVRGCWSGDDLVVVELGEACDVAFVEDQSCVGGECADLAGEIEEMTGVVVGVNGVPAGGRGGVWLQRERGRGDGV
jgi:hypothetical protein